MTLRIDTEFCADDIYIAKPLAPGRPVFMLYGYENDRIVIKRESSTVSQTDLTWINKIMHVIEPQAKPKHLATREVLALKEWVNQWQQDVDTGATTLAQHVNDQGNWVKMSVMQLVTLDEACLKRGQGDKTDVRLIASTLNAPGGLEKLGEVVAADLFNGNGDRFSIFGGITWNGMTFKVLSNVGNVFIAIDPKQKGKIVGMDAFDKGSRYAKMTERLEQATKNSLPGERTWPGVYLRDDNVGNRDQLASCIVADLNLALGPRGRTIPLARKERLVKGAKGRLAKGIETGAKKIMERLSTYKNKHGMLPEGLQDRAKALNWNV